MYPELDSLRGIASLLIVLHHIPKWNLLFNDHFFSNLHSTINLFFVLSGFVICNAYGDKIHTKKDFLRFQFLRLGRLYPVHIFFLFIFAGVEVLRNYAFDWFSIVNPNQNLSLLNKFRYREFVENIFLLQGVIPYRNFNFNFPAWTISVEFYVYILFALIVFIFDKIKVVFFFFLFCFCFVFLVQNKTYGFQPLLNCSTGFFAGCITASFTKRFKFKMFNFLSLTIFFLYILLLFSNISISNLMFFLAPVLIISLVLCPDGILNKFLRVRFLTWLGEVSYSTYMSFALVIWAVNQFIRVFLKKDELVVGARSYPQLTLSETFVACVFVYLILFFISTCVYYFIEKPFRKKSREYAFKNLK
jgi:peptidoglycan/LPS O-acetylase OafA/YrhL